MLDHYQLGLLTLVLTVVVAISGFVILANRHGYGPTGKWRSINRWLHTLLGILLVVAVFLTYFITPPDTLF
ncbi:hypothetical protein [Natronorubrum bangense]|uniref:Cytochrome b561 domain-containing protein n=2 Tax=Natronorubrum bangense TaxID=61858 RepID=L9WCK3_9EURY|nr:hypothetical protein [Natronorubrum bangense]ELY47199.1 hypothetical protein C494_13391 [Natronorubrum bangense JCM 10635]QCC53370.1 hypothetical protein DV706_02045 [Natronorubrum bangense]